MLAAVKKGKKINEEEMPPPVATGKSSYVPQAMGVELENSRDSPENKADSAAGDEQKASPEAGEHLESESLQGRAAADPTVETGTVIWEEKQLQPWFNVASSLMFVVCVAKHCLAGICAECLSELSIECWVSGSGIGYCFRALLCTGSVSLTSLVPQFLLHYLACGIPAFKESWGTDWKT